MVLDYQASIERRRGSQEGAVMISDTQASNEHDGCTTA
jgi:hypothetical protein